MEEVSRMTRGVEMEEGFVSHDLTEGGIGLDVDVEVNRPNHPFHRGVSGWASCGTRWV